MLSLEERLKELEEPPGAELLDMDAVLRSVGYTMNVEGLHRVYYHEAWQSAWTIRNDGSLIPSPFAQRVADFLRLKLKEEGKR